MPKFSATRRCGPEGATTGGVVFRRRGRSSSQLAVGTRAGHLCATEATRGGSYSCGVAG